MSDLVHMVKGKVIGAIVSDVKVKPFKNLG